MPVTPWEGGGPGGSCSVEQFRDSMVNTYKKSPLTIGWINEYSPVLDVTDTVQEVLNLPQGTAAVLVIMGDDLSKIKVVGGYAYWPMYYPDGRPADSAFGTDAKKSWVANWVMGEEWERQTCNEDGKTYWIVYPCRLIIGTPDKISEELEKLAGRIRFDLEKVAYSLGGFFLGALVSRSRR